MRKIIQILSVDFCPETSVFGQDAAISFTDLAAGSGADYSISLNLVDSGNIFVPQMDAITIFQIISDKIANMQISRI